MRIAPTVAMQMLALERSFLGEAEKERLWARHFAEQSALEVIGGTMADAIMAAKEVHCAACSQ